MMILRGTITTAVSPPQIIRFSSTSLAVNSTFFAVYANDANETIHETWTFSPSAGGNYDLTYYEDRFDSSGNLIESEPAKSATVVLHPSGTIEVKPRDQASTYVNIVSESSNFYEVEANSPDGFWEDRWYFDPPDGSIRTVTAPTSAIPFTAQMLDAEPTYYVKYSDNDETVQELWTFSLGQGGGYLLSFEDRRFDAEGNLIATDSGDFSNMPVVLNPDGTITVTSFEPKETTTKITIWAEQEDGYFVDGVVSNGETWSSVLMFQLPPGWIFEDGSRAAGFVGEMLGDVRLDYVFEWDGIEDIGTVWHMLGTWAHYYGQREDIWSVNSFDLVLNPDGTITLTSQESEKIIVVTMTTPVGADGSFEVENVSDGETWTETWFWAVP